VAGNEGTTVKILKNLILWGNENRTSERSTWGVVLRRSKRKKRTIGGKNCDPTEKSWWGLKKRGWHTGSESSERDCEGGGENYRAKITKGKTENKFPNDGKKQGTRNFTRCFVLKMGARWEVKKRKERREA